MDRRAAGALLALAACVASAAAAPTAGNQTALDLYDGASEGCYYNFQHYGEGDRIMTNEPCLNCTCHNRMLMCYLRVCPFTKPIGQDCSVEKRADQCCPIVTCPDVPVDLLTSTSTSSPAEYGETGIGRLDRYGCSINGKYFSEGSKVPSTPNKPCEHCYCIRNMTTCVMQECTLHVDGCTPIYHKDVCCPVRYSCDHPEDELPLLDDMSTTVRPTPGFLLTTTTVLPVTQMTQDCVHDDKTFADGALIKTEKACQHCYCMKGDIVCVVQECGTPMENEGKNCTSMPPREGQCCPDTYICESDEPTTEAKTDFTIMPSSDQFTTSTPPRRVSVEGSGYRNEPDELFTEVPTFEPDTEGSGEELFKPIDSGEMLIPDKVTLQPFVTTEHEEYVDLITPSTTKIPFTDVEISEKTTTAEPDKGENTVQSGGLDEHRTELPIRDLTSEDDTSTNKPIATTESFFEEKTTAVRQDDSSIQDTVTTESDELTTKQALITETTIADYQSPSVTVSIDKERSETTELTPSKQEDEKTMSESTTSKESEELTTKVSDFTVSDKLTTESTTFFGEQAAKTTPVQQLSEEENEVLIKEPTTESSQQTSKPGEVLTETEPPTTKQSKMTTELPTASGDQSQTTPINPVDNEIDEEPFPTSSPGRIPGEGDCLLDGVTYSNESIVPSSNNCHSSCKCISSIVKCDQIICSAPPDYMDNCQPMYDPPESCCPTYVCEHTKETVPPQSHSQMSGTESPAPTPTIECNGDQCEVIKDKDESESIKPCTAEGCYDNLNKKTGECGNEDCQGTDEKTDRKPDPSGSVEDCIGDKCTSVQELCTGNNCETPAKKDQNCDSENGCESPVQYPCQGEDCKIQPEIGPSKDGTTACSSDGCKDDKVPEKTPDCEGESCVGHPGPAVPDNTRKCNDGTDCYKPSKTEPATSVDECNEESCVQKPVSEISKPITDGCTDSECISHDNIPQITSAPVLTEIPVSHETKSEETITDKEEPSKTTQTFVEKVESTTEYSEKIGQKEEEIPPLITIIPAIETQTIEEEQYDSQTEIIKQKGTTTAPLVDTTKQDYEVITMSTEEIITNEPKLSESDAEDRVTEHPDISETKVPESVSPTDQFDEPVTTSHVDTIDNEEKHDITTAPTIVHVDHKAITEPATESQDKRTTATDMDEQDVTTERAQYKPDESELHTESPDLEGPLEETKVPVPSVTERTDSDNYIQGQKGIDGVTDKTVEQEEMPVTSTYGAETKSPLQSPEEKLDTVTNAPITTEAPIKEGQHETLLPVSILPSEETITSKPDDFISASETTSPTETIDDSEELETKAPTDSTSRPEVLIDDIPTRAPDHSTVLPELHVTESQELTTRVSEAPEIEDHNLVTTSQNKEVNKFETDTPMSVVKDRGEDEITTQTSPTVINTMDNEQTTKKPESSTRYSTESYTETMQTLSVKPQTEGIEKDITKMPSLSDKEHIETLTKKPGLKIETTMPIFTDETSTQQSVDVTEKTKSPGSELSTEESPVPVSTPEESSSLGYDEPSVTETATQTTGAPYNVSEKVLESFTQVPTQTVSEEVDIVTPSRDEPEVNKDGVTQIPELTIHEHTDSIFTTMETEKVTELPDASATVTQDVITDKEVTKTPGLQDTVTVISEISVKEPQQEETVTSAPDSQQTEINKLKPQDALNDISEQYSTESQSKPTEIPESQDSLTDIPEITVTEKDKESAVTSLSEITTSSPKLSVPEPAKEETSIPELQTTKTPELIETAKPDSTTKLPNFQVSTEVPDITATESANEITEAPKSTDTTTETSNVSAEEPQGISTEVIQSQDTPTEAPELNEVDPHKEASEERTTTDASISDITAVELDKNITETPEMQDPDKEIHKTELQKETTLILESQDTTTKASDILVTEAQKEVTEIPAVPDFVTIIPNVALTEPQEESSESPEMPNAVTNVPEISVTKSQKETTEVSLDQDIVTSFPEISATESQKEATEPQEIETEIPVTTKITVTTESQNEPTESSVTQVADTKSPGISSTETQKEITDKTGLYDTENYTPVVTTASHKEMLESSGPQDNTNVIPDIPATVTDSRIDATAELEMNTEPYKETTKSPIVESQKDITQSPDSQATDVPKISETPDTPVTVQQKEDTTSESPEITTNISEISTTESHETINLVTKPTDMKQTEVGEFETKTEESMVTEIDNIITETPLKITTKLDEHTESEPWETEMQTESPKIETSPTLPTEGELPNEQSTKIPESLVTEPDHEVTKTDFFTNKPIVDSTDEEKSKEEEKIVTESPVLVSTKRTELIETQKPDILNELPVSQVPVEFNTETPQFDDIKIDVTNVPKVHFTEKEEYVTDAPEGTRRTENITKSPVQPDQSSETKLELPQTTPYLVLLEEHTHKKDINTMSPDDEITTVSSSLPLDYEPSTSEPSIDRITKLVPTSETKMPWQEEATPLDKDQSVQETDTPTPEKATDHAFVSEDTTTVGSTPALMKDNDEEAQITAQPMDVESNEISSSTQTPAKEQSETEKPLTPGSTSEIVQDVPPATEKQSYTTVPEEESILATTKATTIKIEEELATASPIIDKFGKPEELPKPVNEDEKPEPDIVEEIPKPVPNEVQTTEASPQPDEGSHFSPSGTSSYGQEPDYGEEDQPFGPGTCRYGGKVYVSAQQIPRDDPCDFCFCFRSDIICLQQSCPPPIHGCHEEPIQGFCCPRYECPVSMATSVNVTTTTTTTTTTLPPHFLPHAYPGMVQRRGCQIKGHTYKVGEVVRASSGPCLHCTCGGDGQMKCDPKVCTPEPMLRQMIAAAVSAKRRR